MECELQPWAQVANVDSLVVATIGIAPEATMLTAIELLRSFAMAALQHQVRVVVGVGCVCGGLRKGVLVRRARAGK